MRFVSGSVGREPIPANWAALAERGTILCLTSTGSAVVTTLVDHDTADHSRIGVSILRLEQKGMTYRFVFKSAKMLSSREEVSGTTDVLGAKYPFPDNLAPPSNPDCLPPAPTSVRSSTRKDGPANWASSRLSAVDFRLLKAIGNLGIGLRSGCRPDGVLFQANV